MTFLTAASIVLAICAPFLNLKMVSAQRTAPRNGTLPVAPNAPQLQLNSRQTAMQTIFDIDPLTTLAGANASVQQLEVSTIGPSSAIMFVSLKISTVHTNRGCHGPYETGQCGGPDGGKYCLHQLRSIDV